MRVNHRERQPPILFFLAGGCHAGGLVCSWSAECGGWEPLSPPASWSRPCKTACVGRSRPQGAYTEGTQPLGATDTGVEPGRRAHLRRCGWSWDVGLELAPEAAGKRERSRTRPCGGQGLCSRRLRGEAAEGGRHGRAALPRSRGKPPKAAGQEGSEPSLRRQGSLRAPLRVLARRRPCGLCPVLRVSRSCRLSPAVLGSPCLALTHRAAADDCGSDVVRGSTSRAWRCGAGCAGRRGGCGTHAHQQHRAHRARGVDVSCLRPCGRCVESHCD